METRGVAFTREVTNEQLRHLMVETLGGRWQAFPGHEQGVLENGDAIVWATIEPITDLESYEFAEVQHQLGYPPIGYVVVRVGRASGSGHLADIVISRMTQEWTGVEVPSR